MRHIIILICIITMFLQCCYSQKLNSIDSLTRTKAKIASGFLADKILNNSYLLFSMGDKWYLLIVEYKDHYEEYYLQQDTLSKCKLISFSKVNKSNYVLAKAFNKSSYHKGFINLNSDFYKSGYEISEGNITYFYFKDRDGIVYGESKLTSLIKPNPINDEVYNFLLVKILHHISTSGSGK